MFRSSAGCQQPAGEVEELASARHNSHWLSDGKESRYVGYYDAASLYPSSSKCIFFCHRQGVGVVGGGCEVTLPPLVRAAQRSWAAPSKYTVDNWQARDEEEKEN